MFDLSVQAVPGRTDTMKALIAYLLIAVRAVGRSTRLQKRDVLSMPGWMRTTAYCRMAPLT